MLSILDLITILVFLAAAFTYINIHFLKLPSTIGLMILAMVMSLTIILGGYLYPPLSDAVMEVMKDFDFQDVLLNVMLSFLLFAGALEINLEELRKNKWTILLLATAGTIISTIFVGVLMFQVFQSLDMHIDFFKCLLFGALISPTDPIAVLALIKKLNVGKTLEIKISGESLFNDGIGVVLFLTIYGLAFPGDAGAHGHGGETSFLSVIELFGVEVVGGLIWGAVLGYLGFYLLKVIDNDHVELEVLVTISLVLAGARIASLIGVSGPLAMVVMGLFLGNKGRDESLANVTGEYVFKFWHLVDEALNAILFILIGLEMIYISSVFRFDYFTAGVIAIFVVLGARLVGVTIPIKLMNFRRPLDTSTVMILTWGGLRGGISVALALSLPSVITPDGVHVTDIIIGTTYSVVVFSILVQGLTTPKLIKVLSRRQ